MFMSWVELKKIQTTHNNTAIKSFIGEFYVYINKLVHCPCENIPYKHSMGKIYSATYAERTFRL